MSTDRSPSTLSGTPVPEAITVYLCPWCPTVHQGRYTKRTEGCPHRGDYFKEIVYVPESKAPTA